MQNWNKIKWFSDYEESIDTFNYASVPFLISDTEDKLILTKRNAEGKSLPFLYNFQKEELSILLASPTPLLNLGGVGEFDEDGVMPVCSVSIDRKIYLYYIGWNLAVSTPFRNAIGLAISDDEGKSFYKPFRGPVLDRSIHDPCFVASCCVIQDEGIYKMWYLSCDMWQMQDGKLNHKYNIKYATSSDAINWSRNGIVAIDYYWENEYAISVPRVLKEKGIYKMWYSYRGKGIINSYRIGYAESLDGIRWVRKDSEVNLNVSDTGADSDMLCYPFIFNNKDTKWMLYNGNGYGLTGFGIAELKHN